MIVRLYITSFTCNYAKQKDNIIESLYNERVLVMAKRILRNIVYSYAQCKQKQYVILSKLSSCERNI